MIVCSVISKNLKVASTKPVVTHSQLSDFRNLHPSDNCSGGGLLPCRRRANRSHTVQLSASRWCTRRRGCRIPGEHMPEVHAVPGRRAHLSPKHQPLLKYQTLTLSDYFVTTLAEVQCLSYYTKF